MIFLRLFYEFFKVGLFSVGGGLATLPFLRHLGDVTGWFSAADLANMVAVSESTPGAMGVNMATYVGFTMGGQSGLPFGSIVGAVIATLGLVAPSILVILIIAKFLQKFRQSAVVDGVFSGLRPASTGLIAAAGLSVAQIALLTGAPLADGLFAALNLPALALFAVLLVLLNVKRVKNLHPILFIAAGAVAGVLLRMH